MRLIHFIFLISFTGFSQDTIGYKPVESTPVLIEFPEVEPQFPGGINALKRFLEENMVFSEDLFEYDAAGTIYVKVMVYSDGHLGEATIIRSFDERFNQMVIDMVKKMPGWLPAKNKNVPIDFEMRFPIMIDIQ